MISKEELRGYAKILDLNLGQAEKDYFQNVILFVIYKEYGGEIVFKGGTALKKCFGLNRFSEDLDFTCLEKIDLNRIELGLKRFNLDFEVERKEGRVELKVVFRIKGPLFGGNRQSLCKVCLDFSFREKVVLKPFSKTIGRFLEEIPAFDVFVMQEQEILAEKVRTIMARTKARDVYDLWFLLEKGVKIERGLIEEKLSYYNLEWSEKQFVKKLKLTKTIWESELKPLLQTIPNFIKIKKEIIEKISEQKE